MVVQNCCMIGKGLLGTALFCNMVGETGRELFSTVLLKAGAQV